MKQKLLGTAFGRLVMKMRDRIEILKTALFREESAGTITNDWMATFLVTRLCQPGKSFIDVGAHIGSIIAEVSHFDSTIKIIAVEAMPDKALALRSKFPFLELHECAVGEKNGGEITFYVNTKKSGYSSLGKPSEGSKSNTIEIMVSIKKLDSLVTSDDVDVIKIDVEGAELGVLRGSENIISNCRPVIMFESGPPENDGLGYTKDDMWRFFNKSGYEIFVPNRVAHNGPGLTMEGFSESHIYPRRTTNYFAVPMERRIETRDLARNILNIT
jgi:FkbM family methyltransferase